MIKVLRAITRWKKNEEPVRGKLRYKRTLAAMLAAVVVFSVAAATPSQGAVPALDTIRVGLFMDVPGKYTLNTATATVTAAAPIQVGLRQPSGVIPLFQSSAAETIRFTLDDYKPKVLESSEFKAALSAAKRVKALGGTALLTSVFKNNGTVYQVLEGSYGTAAEAKAAGDKWQKDATIASLGGQTEITGPLHYEAGSFKTQAEALAAAKSFGNTGVDAFAAVKSTGGAEASYTVIVGAAAEPAGLNAIKSQAEQADNGLPLIAADAAATYMVLRGDHTLTETPDSAQILYSVPQSESKLWLSTTAASGLKLTERYSRSYRGQIELSGVNKKLTVINELPFEQYLYAVVGAEMPASWPAEALKSQAVAARTYALYQGFKFQIAHVVDTTLSQVYGGIGSEKPTTVAAVDATKGEIIMYNGKPIEAVFSSSAGGQAADAVEIWGSEVGYLKTVASPDESSEKGLKRWHRAVLANGTAGYIREDLLEDSGQKNAAGKPQMRVKSDSVQVRPAPQVEEKVSPLATLSKGTLVTVIETVTESNQMSWIRGPYTSDALLALMKGKTSTAVSGPVQTLEVTQKGPSGRPTELKANGQKVEVKTPDSLRGVFGSLPSTLFTIDQTARLTIVGAGEKVSQRPADSGKLMAAGSGQTSELGANMYIMSGDGTVRAATKEPTFRFVGHGYGHGVGLSQYGALGLAGSGYDYKYILKYYYKDVTIEKE
ncbi:SpoIID/LytB domain-containing protein [Paenibacillus nasutitermitis]|uniref:SPOR domain-containing protein n=1 Tax=Paenibacillus nasutitermitis TaxID=1652958 RepID=A0A917DNI9_9BACL|nr:SpoIID/LytB domain-containing protein [Paenibacillus nasutitermitis]GGD54765.1 hypothetical protein GCM10010911_10520 [Paenibacillus nasutitermitis]